VALKNQQKYSLDYKKKTFALVAKMTTIHTIMAIFVLKG